VSIQGRAALASLAGTLGLARLAVMAREEADAEVIVANAKPLVKIAGVDVALPPDGFIQPTAEGEAAIIEEVLRAAKRARKATDLFCGLGTIALPLAKKGLQVEALDYSAPSIAALGAAARGAGLDGKLKAARHDLMRSPLPTAALDRFDLVVFDPPRSGAAAQAETLARSKVPTVIAVSCNPATFARDARTLADGGYKLERLTPLDQFLWTPHIEVVAVFRR